MKIYLGSDHNGINLKKHLAVYLKNSGYEVVDEGDEHLDPADDFPVFASRVVNAMRADKNETRGILICGSGQGMCMAANRYKGVRASICWNVQEAHAARNDDDSNVLCLSARSTSARAAEPIVNAWLSTAFAGAERFKRRIRELDEL